MKDSNVSKNIKDRTLPTLLVKEKEKKEEEKNKQTEQLFRQPISINTTVIKKDENENIINLTPTQTTETVKTIPVVNQTPIQDDKKILDSIPLVEKDKKEGEITTTTTSTSITPEGVTPVVVDVIPISNKPVSIPTQETTQEKNEGTVTTTTTETSEEIEPVNITVTSQEETTTLTPIVPLTHEEHVHLTIIEEIKEYIDDDLKEVEELAYKIEVLQEQEKDSALLEEQERIRKEIEELERRIDELRKRYEKLYEKLKLQNIQIIDNDILEISIKDYIEDTKEGQDTSKYFDQLEEVTVYLDLLNKIIEVDQEKDELSTKVDQKIDQYENRDQDFIEAQDKKVNINKINYDIEKYNEVVRKALEELEEKMNRSIEVSSKIETTSKRAINWGKILVAIIMLAQTPRIPPTPRGTYLRAALVAVAIHLLLTATYRETTTKKIDTITYTDFRKEIMSSKELLSESLKLIGTSYDELQQIKKMFEDEFGEFANVIPEYSKLVKSIIDLEKELQRQQEKANEYSKELDEKLEINEEKIKRIEEYTTVQ